MNEVGLQYPKSSLQTLKLDAHNSLQARHKLKTQIGVTETENLMKTLKK